MAIAQNFPPELTTSQRAVHHFLNYYYYGESILLAWNISCGLGIVIAGMEYLSKSFSMIVRLIRKMNEKLESSSAVYWIYKPFQHTIGILALPIKFVEEGALGARRLNKAEELLLSYFNCSRFISNLPCILCLPWKSPYFNARSFGSNYLPCILCLPSLNSGSSV